MDITECNHKVTGLAILISKQTRETLHKEYPRFSEDMLDRESRVNVRPGSKYIKVDVGTSGKYMVEVSTGDIYGIKGYGVIHRGHYYGNLDTIDQYYWGNYVAGKIA